MLLIRGLEAELMKEVCSDVKIEPELLPFQTIYNQMRNGNTEQTRVDDQIPPNAPSLR